MHPHLQYPESEGFHFEGGLYFKRLADNRVQILIKESAHIHAPVFRKFVATDSEWASIIASVSMRGDDAHSHKEALELHNKPYDQQ